MESNRLKALLTHIHHSVVYYNSSEFNIQQIMGIMVAMYIVLILLARIFAQYQSMFIFRLVKPKCW